MKVSVIVPFYLGIKWLAECIDSILNQTMTDYEIIVVNDGSKEDDSDFLNKYGNYIQYYKICNKGPAYARNYGIDKAIGEYLAFLDSDDLWVSTKLEKQVKLMDLNNLNWSHTKYSVFDEVVNSKDRVFIEIDNSDFKGNVFPQCVTKLNIGTPCVMIRRKFLQENDFIRFSEKMRFGEDAYFWILIGIENNLGYLDESLTLVRRTGNNAVQRARVHLNVRGSLFNNLIIHLENIFPKVKIGKLTKFTYWYCSKANSIINFLFGGNDFKSALGEIASKVLYLPAYFMFKKVIK